jgi:Ni,Fe-hydrogenase III small subunit
MASTVRRLGIDFVASPRHADGVVVTGPVTRNLETAVRRCPAPATREVTGPRRALVPDGVASCTCDCAIGRKASSSAYDSGSYVKMLACHV